jgi:alanyl-tRNA synthetase
MATIGRGLHYLHKQTEHLSKGDKLQGEVAFKLYDTYGFPLDLTQDILPKDISVDLAGFNAAMLQQKERARAAWKGSGVNAVADVWLALRDEYGATEFLGYNQTKIAANLLAIIKDGKVVEYAATGDVVDLIFNQTVAYGESGGQSGDSGEIFNDDGKLIGVIQDVKKNADLHIHHVALLQKFTVGENVVIAYDNDKRQAVKANHSATHLLHAALREHLGEHVTQKGSLVTNERLRFDFSHNNALSSTELQHIEQRVNEVIWQNAPVQTKLMSADAAIKAGAMALFGEKYSDEVRVLSMGDGYSVELCGGTHVDRTGDIGAFKIVSEQAIAAGVRRIEAVTRAGALQVAQQNEAVLKKMAGMLTSPVEELPNKVAGLLEERKELQQNLANAKKNMALQGGGSSEEQLGDVNFISRNLQGLEAKELRGVAMELLKGRTQAIVAVASEYEGKGAILVAITPDLTSNYDAVKLVQLAVAVLGGKGGGGKADMAQGGGADGSKCAGAINAIKENINGTVSKNL